MISRVRAKQLAAQVLLIVGVLLAGSALVIAARVTLRTSTGAQTSSALHEVAAVPQYAGQLISWLPDHWVGGRQLEPDTRVMVEAAYIRAWGALGHFESTGDGAPLLDTFSGPAQLTALAMPRDAGGATWDIGHRVQLDFYALDGATVAFHDTDAAIVRTVDTAAGEAVLLSHETYDVVMVLEDGYWRIRQLRRGPDPVLVTVSGPAGGRTTVVAPAPHALVPVPALRATEYRPVSWAGLDLNALAADFARARALGITAVRVPLSFLQLGGADPSSAVLADVGALLSTARSTGLKVILVTLDGLDDLSPGNWFTADRQLQVLVSAFRTNPALAMWDVADRPDLRTAHATPTEIRAFLVQAVALTRSIDARTPITISWSDVTDATDPEMTSLTDTVSLHSGLSPSDLPAALSAVRTAAGTRPVMLTVTGPASDGGWGPLPRTEIRQAAAIADTLLAAERAGVQLTCVAALEDSAVEGKAGILRLDASAKPAALLYGPDAELTTTPRPGLADLARGRFWQTLAVATCLAVVGFLVMRRRKRRRDRVGVQMHIPE